MQLVVGNYWHLQAHKCVEGVQSEGGWWVMKTEDRPVVETESCERLLEGG